MSFFVTRDSRRTIANGFVIDRPQQLGLSQAASVVGGLNPPRKKSTSETVRLPGNLKPRSGPTAPSNITLGNLLLSSCPGKKVRLTGPVNGRSAVCRDLQQDLRRMKDLGVGCLVW